MTLLSIAQAVADEVGLPRPTAIASGTDPLARQMFALANATIRDLRKKDWPALVTAYSFNTVVSQEQYVLPTDFHRIISNSAYNASSYYALRNALAPAEWQRQRYGGFGGVGRFKARIFGFPSKISITPTPQVVDSVVYEYISKNSIVKDDASYSEFYTLDDDTAIVPEELVQLGLKWRVKHAKGLDYAEDFNEYENSKSEMLSRLMNLEDIPVAVRGVSDTGEITDGYIPENGFG